MFAKSLSMNPAACRGVDAVAETRASSARRRRRRPGSVWAEQLGGRRLNYTGVIQPEGGLVVLIADAPGALGSRVTAAAARCYRQLGTIVIEKPFAEVTGIDGAAGDAVVAVDEGRIECVVDQSFDGAPLVAGVHKLAADGWTITVLAAASLSGEAHRALRGAPAHIQPWWIDPDDTVCFGAPEVP